MPSTESLENNSSGSLPDSMDTATNLERLKQQAQTSHGNHDAPQLHRSTSSQTVPDQSNVQLFTDSQKEVLRLVGQHLQSLGLG